jgi:hypothetical protein
MSPAPAPIDLPPPIAGFAIRLTGGLAFALLLSPWRLIPPAYFRTMSLVLLGGAVLAAVDLGWVHGLSAPLATACLVAVLAYGAAIGWGLGFARIGLSLFAVIALVQAHALTSAHLSASSASNVRSFLSTATPLASGFLLGAALAAMLLGHHYLTAPAMSIRPLQRLVALTGAALLLRALLALTCIIEVWSAGDLSASPRADLSLLLGMRWLVGLAAPALATFLAWRTARIRSTQSATGILYAGCTLILLGELAAQGLALTTGIPF